MDEVGRDKLTGILLAQSSTSVLHEHRFASTGVSFNPEKALRALRPISILRMVKEPLACRDGGVYVVESVLLLGK